MLNSCWGISLAQVAPQLLKAPGVRNADHVKRWGAKGRWWRAEGKDPWCWCCEYDEILIVGWLFFIMLLEFFLSFPDVWNPCFEGWNSTYQVVFNGGNLQGAYGSGMAVWPQMFFPSHGGRNVASAVFSIGHHFGRRRQFGTPLGVFGWQLTEWAGAMLDKEAASTGNKCFQCFFTVYMCFYTLDLMQDHICSYVQEAPVVCFNNLYKSLNVVRYHASQRKWISIF